MKKRLYIASFVCLLYILPIVHCTTGNKQNICLGAGYFFFSCRTGIFTMYAPFPCWLAGLLSFNSIRTTTFQNSDVPNFDSFLHIFVYIRWYLYFFPSLNYDSFIVMGIDIPPNLSLNVPMKLFLYEIMVQFDILTI